MIGVRRYASRVLLFIILMLFLGCCEDEGCSGGGICGGIPLDYGADLTAKNNKARLETPAAYFECGATCIVTYKWRGWDVDENGEGRVASKPKDRPPVSVKMGTVEGRGQATYDNTKFNPADENEWQITCEIPRSLKEDQVEGALTPVHFFVEATLKKPLIKMPDKSPTISLPFIGTIMGPEPPPVSVALQMISTAVKRSN